jgi:hypothetical protein
MKNLNWKLRSDKNLIYAIDKVIRIHESVPLHSDTDSFFGDYFLLIAAGYTLNVHGAITLFDKKRAVTKFKFATALLGFS